MPHTCTLEGCSQPVGDGIVLTQSGVVIGAVCEDCLGSAKGAKLIVRKDEDGEFELIEMQRLENPL
jgi:hypothetical protein